MTADEEREIALAVLKRIYKDSDNSSSRGDDRFLHFSKSIRDDRFKHFSESIRGDKDIALKFVRKDGKLLQWCSDRLKEDMEVVKTAI